MRIGPLRHRIQFERPVRTSDGQGGQVMAWEKVGGERSAQISPLKGTEYFGNDQMRAAMDTKIIFRWHPNLVAAGINATWRIVHKTTIYNLVGDPVEKELKREYFEVMCKSGVNRG